MQPVLCSASPAASGRSSRRRSRTAPTTPNASPPPPTSCLRSCASTPIRSASSSSRGAGWSSGSSPGSIATGAWPRMSRPPSRQPSPSSTPPPSCSSPAASHAPHEFQNRLLGEAVRPYFLDRVALVVEDTNADGGLYDLMLRSLRDRAKMPVLNWELVHGGGDRLAAVVDSKIRERRIVCAVVDSDHHS